MRKGLAMFVAVFVSVIFLFSSVSSFATGEIKIGIIDTYSGPPSSYALDVLDSSSWP